MPPSLLLSLLLLAFALPCAHATVTPNFCGDDPAFSYLNGRCYYLLGTQLPWQGAGAQCQALGTAMIPNWPTRLVDVHTPEENAKVAAMCLPQSGACMANVNDLWGGSPPSMCCCPTGSPTGSPQLCYNQQTGVCSQTLDYIPSAMPSTSPTYSQPSATPSHTPSRAPSSTPSSSRPSKSPTRSPSRSPTKAPRTSRPSRSPSSAPTSARPSRTPTSAPSSAPATSRPSQSPLSARPSVSPTKSPTARPSKSPSRSPSTIKPSRSPSGSPTRRPSKSPSRKPSRSPTTLVPSASPTTKRPSGSPTRRPSRSPSKSPSRKPSRSPSASPTRRPTFSPSRSPSASPSGSPTFEPSVSPSRLPTAAPSRSPIFSPSKSPSRRPTKSPHVSKPSASPTLRPSRSPTTARPSRSPTHKPTMQPHVGPTTSPVTTRPSRSPSNSPSSSPTRMPSGSPTASPVRPPTQSPTTKPTHRPTPFPTWRPTRSPTHRPSRSPTRSPTESPSRSPTRQPTRRPSTTAKPTTTSPTSRAPTLRPTPPSFSPTSSRPSNAPVTAKPSGSPTLPTGRPSASPTRSPSHSPSKSHPSYSPSQSPSHSPSRAPSRSPSVSPSVSPSSARPSISPSTMSPSASPSRSPSQSPGCGGSYAVTWWYASQPVAGTFAYGASSTGAANAICAQSPYYSTLQCKTAVAIVATTPTSNFKTYPPAFTAFGGKASDPIYSPNRVLISKPYVGWGNATTGIWTSSLGMSLSALGICSSNFWTGMYTKQGTYSGYAQAYQPPTPTPSPAAPQYQCGAVSGNDYWNAAPSTTAITGTVGNCATTANSGTISVLDANLLPTCYNHQYPLLCACTAYSCTAAPTSRPTTSPTTKNPTRSPSSAPVTSRPSRSPTRRPSRSPTSKPTKSPYHGISPSGSPTTARPSRSPTRPTTHTPSTSPTRRPSSSPTSRQPSISPSNSPVRSAPSKSPGTDVPSFSPSRSPSRSPRSQKPSKSPTSFKPSKSPSKSPVSHRPSASPTHSPSRSPSSKPSKSPTSMKPSASPTSKKPSASPTSKKPSASPFTKRPSVSPTLPTKHPSTHAPSLPTGGPTTHAPTLPTSSPTTHAPTTPSPTFFPTTTSLPTLQPTTAVPTHKPSKRPTPPTFGPTGSPVTSVPTQSPINAPSYAPFTSIPSRSPTYRPTSRPTFFPTLRPTTTKLPTKRPTPPTSSPSRSPTTHQPTPKPEIGQTQWPSHSPVINPSSSPTVKPVSSSPSQIPTTSPVASTPTQSPTIKPSKSPTPRPTLRPSRSPTTKPTHRPSASPTVRPSRSPSQLPTVSPHFSAPTVSPSQKPTKLPTASPSTSPTTMPSQFPSASPSLSPGSSIPSVSPSQKPTMRPTFLPSASPSTSPTTQPSRFPTTASPTSSRPSRSPSFSPSRSAPSRSPTTKFPSRSPSRSPTFSPTRRPSRSPTSKSPSASPTRKPSASPTSVRPSRSPSTTKPSRSPSSSRPSKSPSKSPVTRSPTSSPTLRPICPNGLAPDGQTCLIGRRVLSKQSWINELSKVIAKNDDVVTSQDDKDWLTSVARAISRFTSSASSAYESKQAEAAARASITADSVNSRDLGVSASPTASPHQKCVHSPVIVLCQPPPSYNLGKGVGRGECWLGATRYPGTSVSDQINWKTVAGITTSVLSPAFNNWEQGLQVYNATLGSFLNPGGSHVIPSCLAMWGYSTPGKWTMDVCSKAMPSVCVRDARCPASYYKTATYQVDALGKVNPGTCQLCPAGQYRNTSDDESNCLDCDAGYYGNASLSNRMDATCSGFCPQGTYCNTGSGLPVACLPGTYGVPLVNPTQGPGWSSYSQACQGCPPGFYCDALANTNPFQHQCQPGVCGYLGQQLPTCSESCPEGYYCPGGSACPDAPWATGISYAHPCGDGFMGAGYPSGAAAYCPSGSRSPQLVAPGYYGAGGLNTSYNAYELPCPIGSFCVNGTTQPCPAGSYTSATMQSSCSPCQAGYFCPLGSTSATQQLCAPSNATNPAQYYCPSGTNTPLLIVDGSLQTLPASSGSLYTRQAVQPCPSDKVCVLGLALDRIVWNGACSNTGGNSLASIPELWSSLGSGVVASVTMQAPLSPSDFIISYSLASQSFYNPALCPTSTNDGIFGVNASTGEVELLRYWPDPYNHSSSLDYEACPPHTVVQYALNISAMAVNRSNPAQASSSLCTLTINVVDQNDQPIFPESVSNPTGTQNRFILDSAADNTPALRCSSQSVSQSGCPVDPLTTAEVVATDQDEFGKGNLFYSFIGPLSAAQNKLKINACTGLISANGLGPTWNELPPFDQAGIYRRIAYTVLAEDDGNYGKFPKRNQTITVYVYVQNINHAPVLYPTSFSIQELLPAGTPLTPPAPLWTDIDVGQDHYLSIVQNDGGAFEVVNNTLVTTALGAQDISYQTAKKQYSIKLAVTDNGTPPLSATMTYVVNVLDNNVPPVIDQTTLVFYVSEFANPGDPVCHSQTGVCSMDSHVVATDVNIDIDGITTDKITFSLSNSAGGRFAIDPVTGIITVVQSGSAISFLNSSYNLPVGGTGRGFMLGVVATSDGNGTCPNPVPAATGATAYVYLVHENHAPYFNSPVILPLLETAPLGSTVALISASDPDNTVGNVFGAPYSLQSLTYTLIPNGLQNDGSGLFHISSANGVTSILVAAAVSYNSAPSCYGGASKCYALTVVVTDNGNPQLSAQASIVVNVTQINHAPVIPNALQVSIVEDVDVEYQSAFTIADQPLSGSDVDAGDNARLTYTITGGSGTNAFTIVSLGPGNGFVVQKLAGALLNFELVSLYTLVVTVSDYGPSKSIGAECSLLSASSDCGAGAVCDATLLRCLQRCTTLTDSRVNTFFCVHPMVFNETASTTVSINVQDANDKPFVVWSSQYPAPNVISNTNCTLTGAVTFVFITGALAQDQSPISNVIVWDDDVNYVHKVPHPEWGPPYTFTTLSGSIWDVGFLLDGYQGTVTLPMGTPNIYVGQQWTGSFSLTDWSGAISTCNVVVNVVESTVVPNLGKDRFANAILEHTPPGGVVFSFGALDLIDLDVLNDPPEVLTFFISTNPYFSINSTTGDLTLTGDIDYEQLSQLPYPYNFTVSAQVLVEDLHGNTAGCTITFPVIEVLEPPYWVGTPVTLYVNELVPNGTLTQPLTNYARITDVNSHNLTWTTLEFFIVSGSGPFQVQGNALASTGPLIFPNIFNFVIRAQLLAGPYADADVTVVLLEVEQPPQIVSGHTVTVAEGTAGQLFDLTTIISDPNTWDHPVGQKLSVAIVGGDADQTFAVSSGFLSLSAQGVLDYEYINLYNLSILVTDTRGETALGYLIVNVTNINDVSITSITLLDTIWAACDGTTPSKVSIIGTNLGMVSESPSATFTLAYSRSTSGAGSQPPSFATQNCTAVSSNVEIVCWITGTAGVNLIFNLSVTVPSTQINGDGTSFASAVSFAPPVLEQLTVGTSSGLLFTAGGNTLMLSGSCLGSPADSLSFGPSSSSDSYLEVLTLGETWRYVGACQSTAANGTLLVCSSSSLVGLGQDIQWKVRVGMSQLSPALVQGAYAPPSLVAILQEANSSSFAQPYGLLDTTGVLLGGAIDLVGTNFGDINSRPDIAYLEYNPPTVVRPYRFYLHDCQVVTAFTKIRCTSVDPGAGANLNVTVSFGAQFASFIGGPKLSFVAPTMTDISGSGAVSALTLGGQLVLITGTSFGPKCGLQGTDASTAVNCDFILASYTRNSTDINGNLIVYKPQYCAVISQALLACTTVPGTGKDLVWSIAIGSQTAQPTSTFGTTSYAAPVIGTYVSGYGHLPLVPFDTAGNEVLIVQGSYFGPVGGAPVVAYYGPPASPLEFQAHNCLVTLADVEITCTTAPGAGSELSWTVVLDGLVSRAELTSYGIPVITSITYADGSPALALNDEGGEALVLHGYNFGSPLSHSNGTNFLELITYGPLDYVSGIIATHACVVVSHFAINCTSMPGVGQYDAWQVRIRGQDSDPGVSPLTSYVATLALNMTSDFSSGTPCSTDTSGGTFCYIRAQGVGFCSGAQVHIVFGNELVSVQSVLNNQVAFTQSGCPYSQVDLNRDLLFIIPPFDGLAGSPPFQVSVKVTSPLLPNGFLTSPQSFIFTYGAPVVAQVYAEPALGSAIAVTLSGSNFCASELCCQTMYQYIDQYNNTITQPAQVTSHTHTQVSFIAPGIGSCYINCTGTGITDVKPFSQHNPFIFGATKQSSLGTNIGDVQFDTQGGDLVYIWGAFFGRFPQVTIGGQVVPILDMQTPSCGTSNIFPSTISLLPPQPPQSLCYQLLIAIPPGQGVGLPVVVTNVDLQSLPKDSRFEFVNYGAPQITGLGAAFSNSNPTSGSSSILLVVFGHNFGLNGTIVFGPVGGIYEISCSPSGNSTSSAGWGHTRVACFLPPGEGSGLAVSVISAGRQSPTYGALNYAAPQPLSYTILSAGGLVSVGDTRGSQTLEIVGMNFGRLVQPDGPFVMVGKWPCTVFFMDVTFATQNRVRCYTPAGEGAGLTITVHSAGVTSPLQSLLFNYGSPVIYSITPSTARTDALTASNGTQVMLHINGLNFGINLLEVEFISPQGGSSLVLGYRDLLQAIPVNDFAGINGSFANHTDIIVPLPPFVGANLTLRILVAGQTNDNSTLFSYLPPVVTTLNGSPVVSNSVGRRRMDNAKITGFTWSTHDLPCRYVLFNGTVSLAYTELVNLTSSGLMTKTIDFFSLASNSTCAPSSFLGTTVVSGVWTDLGQHPTLACLRLYHEAASATGFTLPQGYNIGGYGAYFVAQSTDAYFSHADYSTLSLMNSSLIAPNIYDEYPTLVIQDPPVDNLTSIPTSGCLFWEAITDYQNRLQQAQPGAVLPRKCLKPVLLSVEGANFGNGGIPGSLRVWLVDIENNIMYEGSTTGSGGNHNLLCSTAMGCVHTDTLIVFMAPMGAGKGLAIRIQVGNLVYQSGPTIDYDGPFPTSLNPGSIIAGNPFLSGVGGQALQIQGSGMGYSTSPLGLFLNARPCNEVEWQSGDQAVDGEPSIACSTPKDVAGIRSVFVCVGGQGYMTGPRRLQDISALQAGQKRGAWASGLAPLAADRQYVQALAVAVCPNNTYGDIGELCIPCPANTVCAPGLGLPIAQPGFTTFELDISDPYALSGNCAPERIDASYQLNYSRLVQQPTCHAVLACTPPDSCLGANQCEVGYQYEYKNCLTNRQALATNQTCSVTRDPYTGLWRGNDQDCRVQKLATGAVCTSANPMDCSSCHIYFNGTDGTGVYGLCECDMPPRCSLCTVFEYYRLNNKCTACPQNPGLIMALFVMAAVGLIVLGYWLQKKNVNLGFLSVGVDYFQILGVLATTNVPWPPVILEVFQIFEVFLASIDIAAPECLISNLEFPAKFYFTETMPFMALGILLIVHLGYTAQKLYKYGKRIRWLSHVGRLVGIYILILYVLYLSLTKYALDVFNCNPLSPDDGYEYTTFSSLSCDGGGLCRCNQPGGLQQMLVAPAVGFLILYSIGFPLVVASILFFNRHEIEEDQYLRAYKLGTRHATNLRAWSVRKKYKLIYMYYKPEYHWWMLAVLARKFFIAFAALMFRGNASFQLATILIVLFVCFTVQVKNRPYMSTGEYPLVVYQLNQRSKLALEDSSMLHYRDIVRKVAESQEATNRISRSEKAVRTKALGDEYWDSVAALKREKDSRSQVQRYFFDLNAVEAILLGSITVISLSGIMFESGQFTSRPDLYWTGEMTTILVFVLLFGTLLYYFAVFINEFAPMTFARYCGRFIMRFNNDKEKEVALLITEAGVQLDTNPLFKQTSSKASSVFDDRNVVLSKELEDARMALRKARELNDTLIREKSSMEQSV